MKKKRKQYTFQEKVTILKRHLVDNIPVSDMCDEHEMHPNVFYRWQSQFFEGGVAAFERASSRELGRLKRQVAALEERLVRKDAVLAEITEEYVRCKKKRWIPLKGRWVPGEVRDAMVAFISHCAEVTEIPVSKLLKWLGLSRGRYYRWVARYGQENQHNAPVLRRFWLLAWERLEDDDLRKLVRMATAVLNERGPKPPPPARTSNIANVVIAYNSVLLSRLLVRYQAAGNQKALELLKKISPIAWQHIHFLGHYIFRDNQHPIDLEAILAGVSLA